MISSYISLDSEHIFLIEYRDRGEETKVKSAEPLASPGSPCRLGLSPRVAISNPVGFAAISLPQQGPPSQLSHMSEIL